MEKVSYRRADVNDVEVLVDYRIRFLNALHNHPDNEETEMLRESLRRYFAEAIPSGNFIAWLAEYEGKVIGTSGMVVWRRPANYGGLESGKLGYLLNFYTIREARRRGVATRLLDELIKEAGRLGLKYLHLNATEEGMSIYRKAGFVEPIDVELELRLEDGHSFPQTIKELPEADVLVEGVKGWIAQGEKSQIVFFEIEPLKEMPEHSHDSPQWGIVVEGKMELTVEGKPKIYGKGDEYFIPANTKHSARFLSKFRAMDFFGEKMRYKHKRRSDSSSNRVH